ncbi:MAG: 2OG-Fe(II) oxygenase [uncultured Campylobacterales bacterium]|uniref:2OG-Fe(II) oxygenase n=1 Tax=uncultured Campylobacterales bacterium TaxID=352960 RepID=A0A6S6SVC1_9BACT|nr:MAG: 2OG-Fe(II) oxygenase [uncultured Campylobacterales bacterium]
MIYDREYFSKIIADKILKNENEIYEQFNSGNKISSFIIDELLPVEEATKIYNSFPKPEDMKVKKSLREYKFIDAQLNKHNKILEEITYAFHEKIVIDAISKTIKINGLIADEQLYAGGLSRMEKGQYLNPHLDNSHNKDRSLYRVLNLLYYVSPNRKIEDGGNLELWDEGPKKEQRTIYSKFNRLVVMITNRDSWHSVSKLEKGARCCISNYYFSEKPLTKEDYFHITSFRGFPNQYIRDKVLLLDIKLRMGLRKIFKKGIVDNSHVYKK